MAGLERLKLDAAVGNGLAMVLYCIEQALAVPAEGERFSLAREMADDSVKDFTRKLVQAHRAAGHLTFEAWDAIDGTGRFTPKSPVAKYVDGDNMTRAELVMARDEFERVRDYRTVSVINAKLARS